MVKKSVLIRILTDDRKRLKALAKKDRRTMCSIISILLDKASKDQ